MARQPPESKHDDGFDPGEHMKTGQILAMIALVAMAITGAARSADPPANRSDESGHIYRTVDEDGNTVFTDNPADKDRAEPVTVGPVNTMEGRRAEVPAASDEAQGRLQDEPADNAYRSVEIITPADGATVRIPQDNPVTVRATSDPAPRAGHRLVILDNGTPLDKSVLDFPDPGTHQLQAIIEDANGRPLIRSAPVTFYVHRTKASDAASGTGNAYPSRGDASRRGEAAGRAGHARPGGAAQRGSGAALGGGAQRVTRPSK